MVVPFKIVRNPYDRNKYQPVYAGDDADVLFKTSHTARLQPVGLGEPGKTDGQQWVNNKFSTKQNNTNQTYTIVNALDLGQKPESSRINTRRSMYNY
jgi:hypothetical protein|tara:strand:+ start:1590 stop:1880 length:291 start_codon:yes stop_codon:yes gene_type:complete